MFEDEEYYLAVKDNFLREINLAASGIDDSLGETGALEIRRVLDVGCGIGQALFPLAVQKGAFGVGIDVSGLSLRMGREFYAAQLPAARVEFIRTGAESLPFAPDSFDLVNCGLALPYMRNAQAIAEMARVLRRGGILLLKIHHARYYLERLWEGLSARDVMPIIHGGRVLTAGTLYHLTGRQPRSKILNETYQTKWLLGRELRKHGLVIEREQSKTNPLTPAFVIRKK